MQSLSHTPGCTMGSFPGDITNTHHTSGYNLCTYKVNKLSQAQPPNVCYVDHGHRILIHHHALRVAITRCCLFTTYILSFKNYRNKAGLFLVIAILIYIRLSYPSWIIYFTQSSRFHDPDWVTFRAIGRLVMLLCLIFTEN